MARNTPCRDAFIAAQERRTLVPLRMGLYKIHDAMSDLYRIRDTVDAIAEALSSERPLHPHDPLVACTVYEKDTYLLAVPVNVAETLGYDMLPAVKALSADGWPPELVANAVDIATNETAYVLSECERVHRHLQSGLAGEYTAIKQGGSMVRQLIRDAEKVGQAPLQFHEIVKTLTDA